MSIIYCLAIYFNQNLKSIFCTSKKQSIEGFEASLSFISLSDKERDSMIFQKYWKYWETIGYAFSIDFTYNMDHMYVLV